MVAPALEFISSFDVTPVAIVILAFILVFTLMRRTSNSGESGTLARSSSGLSSRGTDQDLTFDPVEKEKVKQGASTEEAAVRGEYAEELKEAKLIEEMEKSFNQAAAIFTRIETDNGFADESKRQVFIQEFKQFVISVQLAENHFHNLEAEELLIVQEYRKLEAELQTHSKADKVKSLMQDVANEQQIVINKTQEVKKIVLEIDIETKKPEFSGSLILIEQIHTFPSFLSTSIYQSNTLGQYLEAIALILKAMGEKDKGLISQAINAQKEAITANKEVYRGLEKVKAKLS